VQRVLPPFYSLAIYHAPPLAPSGLGAPSITVHPHGLTEFAMPRYTKQFLLEIALGTCIGSTAAFLALLCIALFA